MAEETRRVIIAYSPNLERIGKEETLPAEEARALVNEGRARYADEDKKSSSKSETK